MNQKRQSPRVETEGQVRKQTDDDTQTITQATDAAPWTVAEGIRRRRDAALRIPPMPCGCVDPDSLQHRFDRCPRRRRGGRRG